MKTVIIFDDCEANIRFFVVTGSFAHLDGKYINGNATDEEVDQINKLVYDEEYRYLPSVEHWPAAEVADALNNHGGFEVIVCGFIP